MNARGHDDDDDVDDGVSPDCGRECVEVMTRAKDQPFFRSNSSGLALASAVSAALGVSFSFSSATFSLSVTKASVSKYFTQFPSFCSVL